MLAVKMRWKLTHCATKFYLICSRATCVCELCHWGFIAIWWKVPVDLLSCDFAKRPNCEKERESERESEREISFLIFCKNLINKFSMCLKKQLAIVSVWIRLQEQAYTLMEIHLRPYEILREFTYFHIYLVWFHVSHYLFHKFRMPSWQKNKKSIREYLCFGLMAKNTENYENTGRKTLKTTSKNV